MTTQISSKAFFDFDVLVAAHSKDEGNRASASRRCIEQAWRERSGVVSTSILREFYDGLRNDPATMFTAKHAIVCIEDYLTWHVVVDDVMTLIDAMTMDQNTDISVSTALVVQAALAGGATTIFSYRTPLDIGDTPVRILRPPLENES